MFQYLLECDTLFSGEDKSVMKYKYPLILTYQAVTHTPTSSATARHVYAAAAAGWFVCLFCWCVCVISICEHKHVYATRLPAPIFA